MLTLHSAELAARYRCPQHVVILVEPALWGRHMCVSAGVRGMMAVPGSNGLTSAASSGGSSAPPGSC